MGKASQELQRQLDAMKSKPKKGPTSNVGRSKPDEPEPAGAEVVSAPNTQTEAQDQETTDMATKTKTPKAAKAPKAAKIKKAKPEKALRAKGLKSGEKLNLNTALAQRTVHLGCTALLKDEDIAPEVKAEAKALKARIEKKGVAGV
jgi:hypothetical protein